LSDTLTFTGERFLPEVEGEISYEHWHRYAFAQNLCQDKIVLDVACGEGYGSSLLAKKAQSVIGVDISEEAVAHAKNRYASKVLEFIPGSCDDLPFADDSFDVAVSYETIEHIETQEEFLTELVRVLKPDGILILSSPNKHLYSDAHDHHNEFHVKELYRDELKALLEDQLKDSFPHIHWLGQKLLFHSAIWPEEQDFQQTDYLQKDDSGVGTIQNPDVEPMYYIVVCSKGDEQQPELLNRLSLFSESSEVIYQDYCKHIQRVIELDQLLKDREEKILERDKTLKLRTAQMTESEGLIEERDELLAVRTRQTVAFEEQVRERDALLKLRTEQLEEKVELIAERDELLELRTRQMDESESLIAERDELLKLRNSQMDESESVIAETKRLIAERDELLDLRNAQLLEREKIITDRENLIVERDAMLQLRNQQMIEREEMIEERDAKILSDAQLIEKNSREHQELANALHENSTALEEMAGIANYRSSFSWWLRLPIEKIKQVFNKV
jgi:ubiquinone/menaquinone biosynthesis C-methylase UbiE